MQVKYNAIALLLVSVSVVLFTNLLNSLSHIPIPNPHMLILVVVALDRLNASSDRIQEYWDMYTSMTPYNMQLHKVDVDWKDVTPATKQEWNDWRGQKVHWQEQTMFVYNKLQNDHDGNTGSLLQELAPDLLTSPSLAGALTHGIIHLGWGVDAQSPWMISEGLAYLNFCAVGVNPTKLEFDHYKEETTPMDSIIRIAQTWHDEALQSTWVEPIKAKYDESSNFHTELIPAGFQWEAAKIMYEPHPIVTKIPSWLSTLPLSELYESLYRTVTYLYLATRDENGHGNFVLLHLITSLWGLEHVLNVVEDDETVSRKAIGQWCANTISLLATSSDGIPSPETLRDIQKEFPIIKEKNGDKVDDWTSVVERGIVETEEHNIKLVYVAKELWNRYDHWDGFYVAAQSFTLTPNIGPDTPEYDA